MIRCRTPEYCGGFCELSRKLIIKGNYLKLEEMDTLIAFFRDKAYNTNFVTEEDIKLNFLITGRKYIPIADNWLFCPEDWVSRRKWLKKYIKSIKDE